MDQTLDGLPCPAFLLRVFLLVLYFIHRCRVPDHFRWLQQLYQSLHHLCRDLRRVLLSTVAHALLSRHAMREKQPENERLSEGSPEGETFDRSTTRGRQIATREPQKDVS